MATFPSEWWTQTPLIVAHRGANHVAPENTLPAFQKAIDVGAHGVELDVQLTVDGVPVVIHDAAVDRTTNGSGLVSNLTIREIKSLDTGSYFDAHYRGVTIPTLEEVFDSIGNKTLINIELKASSNGYLLGEKVCQLIATMGVGGSVWFSSFNYKYLKQARKVLPSIPNGYLFSVRTLLQRIIEKSTHFEAVHPYYRCVTQKYVERVHRKNQRIAVWTVDDVEAAYKLKDMNVDVVITNEPAKLLKHLG